MAGFKGKVDQKGLLKFQKNLKKLSDPQRQEWNEAVLNELAMRLLALVKKRTPVGKYKQAYEHVLKSGKNKGKTVAKYRNPTGKTGGTLRKGWTVEDVKKTGDTYEVRVINNVEYASYVEFGHRGVYVPALGKTLHKDTHMTPGQYMLTISEQELENDAQRIIVSKLKKFMGEAFK